MITPPYLFPELPHQLCFGPQRRHDQLACATLRPTAPNVARHPIRRRAAAQHATVTRGAHVDLTACVGALVALHNRLAAFRVSDLAGFEIPLFFSARLALCHLSRAV